MRIKTDGRYTYRADLYEDTAELLGENARCKGLDAACEFTRRVVRNLERAIEHEDMTPELAGFLSTPTLQLHYEISTDVEINE